MNTLVLGTYYVPRKQWKFGNEYHNMGCALSDVIWQVDLSPDRPAHLGKKEYDELGSTVGTLLHLTKPIHGTGKVFVLDSGFCVLRGLVELKKKGVFAHALIKKGDTGGSISLVRISLPTSQASPLELLMPSKASWMVCHSTFLALKGVTT